MSRRWAVPLAFTVFRVVCSAPILTVFPISNHDSDYLPPKGFVDSTLRTPRPSKVSWWHPVASPEPSFMGEPKTRGTVGIIISSVITLTLCVYTAIHLNICSNVPVRFLGLQLPRSWVYKFYWVMIALFAPRICAVFGIRPMD